MNLAGPERTVKTNAVIRQARMDDVEDLIELLQVLFSIEVDFTFDAIHQRQGLTMMVANEDAVVLVAEVDGKIVGMSSGQLTVSTAEGGNSLLVEDVVVHEAWRGNGLGRQLMEALSQWARSREVSRLQLLADRHNSPALQFYATLGWQSTELICLRQRLTTITSTNEDTPC